MYTDVDFSIFVDSFRRVERENNFSHNGLWALYDFLTEIEEDTGEEFELNPVALCCDYTEYKSLKEIKDNYSIIIAKNNLRIENLDDLREYTDVIEFEGGLIIKNLLIY